MGVRRQPDGMSEANLQGPATVRASFVAPIKVVGTQPRPVFGNIDYQSVIKRTVETQSKKVHVSTPMLKLHLIINDLRNPSWPRPASSPSALNLSRKNLEKVYSAPCEKSRKGVYLLLSKLYERCI